MPERPALTAELWYLATPDLDDPELLDTLQAAFPDAQRQEQSIVIPHAPERNGSTLLTAVLFGSDVGVGGKTKPDVGQTWDWPEAEDAVARATGSVLVLELQAAGSGRQARVDGLTSVVTELVRRTSPTAISWPHSQRVTDPSDTDAGPLDGVLNVRLFSVSGDDEALVMDSCGLHLFDLPDVQCHFHDREPGEIAALLFSLASYVFAEGDVIADGHTVSGLQGDEAYVCRREQSLVAPARDVLDLDLGDPYAAGRRDR